MGKNGPFGSENSCSILLVFTKSDLKTTRQRNEKMTLLY